MQKSIEESVEDSIKEQLKNFEIKYFKKTDSINPSIDNALKNSKSKSGGDGNNFPDIKILLTTDNNRQIPVMIEAKGKLGDLVKYKNGTKDIELVTEYSSDTKSHKKGEKNYTSIQKYAVNGAIHYTNAIINNTKDYNEGIAIGISGFLKEDKSLQTELLAYYISKETGQVPLYLGDFDDLSFLKKSNLKQLVKKIDELALTDEQLEDLKSQKENELEIKVKAIHQALYNNDTFKNALETNQKLYLFCGLIMAGLPVIGVADLTAQSLTSNDNMYSNDGTLIINQIRTFLNTKHSNSSKNEMIMGLLEPVFKITTLYKPINGESPLKNLFKKVKDSIIPCLTTELHIDFAGKILNSLNDWVHVENDKANDVVLTPRYVTKLMATLAQTNKDSFVWDSAMGSAGFLVSAMEIMINDAKKNITDTDELNKKIQDIKQKQLLGIEILGNIYILAVLNMILMGDGSSKIVNQNSFDYEDNFPATVFLLNPPYSASGKGFNFVERALSKMQKGYGCILIQENAGSGTGLPYTKDILKNNTLVASIKMPLNLFSGKSTVQTAIYLFKVNKPHDVNSLVTFIDFSNDGYDRKNKKKSGQEVNLKNVDNAKERYDEIADIILNRKKKTNYYSEDNGLIIKDTISLDGKDWTYVQHKKIDIIPTEKDFMKTVSDYLSWKVSTLLKDENVNF